MNKPTKVKTAGLTLNARIEGSGPPLLFLGGSNFDLSIKAPVFDSVLPTHFTVAASDPRGLGQTDQPSGDWCMQDYAYDALNLMDALGWDNAHVLGESFGAMVALHLAALAPDRINRLALAACSPGGAGGSSYPVEKFLQISDPFERARLALEVIDKRFSKALRDTPKEAEQRIQDRAASDAVFISSHNNASGYPRLLSARAEHDCWNQLPEIKVPTLVFAGQHDNQAPLERAENITGAMPNATLVIVDGCHGHCFNTPTPVATIVERWVG